MIEEEYGIKANTCPPGNPQANEIKYMIDKLLGNILSAHNMQETYVDDAELWIDILAAATFAVHSTYHRVKGKMPGQMIFGRGMIIKIENCYSTMREKVTEWITKRL